MSTDLRVLFVEDNPADAELMAHTLEAAGYKLHWKVVESRAEFRNAVQSGKLDIVISNYKLPRFDGLSALAILRDSGRDIPLILVSGTLGEEKAVAVMKAGASDFILKGNMARLAPAVTRELRDTEERRARRSAEAALARRDEQLRLALNAAEMGTWDWDLASDRLVWSEHAEAILLQARPAVPRTRAAYLAVIPDGDRDTVERSMTEAVDRLTDFQVAHRIVTRSGPVHWLGLKGRVYEEDGQPVRMSGTIADITRRKESEAALIESEQRYRDLYENAPVALFSINRENAIVRANRRATALFGFEVRELLGVSALDLFADTTSGRAHLEEMLRRAHGGDAVEDEVVHVQRPGSGLWWGAMSVRPVKNADDQVIVLRATLVDITARRQAEELLQLSHRAIDQSPDFILICDPDYAYRRVNSAMGRAYGLDPNELVGKKLVDVLGEDVFEVIKPHFDACLLGRDASFQIWVDYPSIGRRFMDVSYTPLRSPAGHVEGIIVIARDQTERQSSEERHDELEARLRQAQKMEALGTLAGGIAHDFNNLLLAILGFGELVRDTLAEGSTERAHAEQIINAGERAQSLVQQILAFGRRTDQSLQHVLVQEIVQEATSFLKATFPATIEVDLRMAEEECVVLGDASQLQQVVLNLGSNAFHAMRDTGGSLTIRVNLRVVEERLASQLGGLPPGEYVRMTVADTGPGMPPEIRDRIYDPFFTTKGPGEGTGLGLSVVHGIVLSHHGGLTVRSSPGRGTRFDVYLPRSGEPPATAPRAEPARHGAERILFIDDEPPIAQLGRQLLTRLGYDVTIVSDSREALQLFTDQPDQWDLIITDQTMPQHTGLEVVRLARAVRDGIPAILTTGFSESVTPEALVRQGVNALLMKPYGGAELGQAVRRVLDDAQNPAIPQSR